MFAFAWEHNVLPLRDIVCIPLQIDFQFFSTKRAQKKNPKIRVLLLCTYAPNTLRTKPAATAEPITPATFGPIACMSRKFAGLAF